MLTNYQLDFHWCSWPQVQQLKLLSSVKKKKKQNKGISNKLFKAQEIWYMTLNVIFRRRQTKTIERH